MDLGAPIGQRNTVPSDGFDQGEHGAGIGLSGGADAPNAHNSQSGGLASSGQDYSSGQGQYGDDFNSGLGGERASGGIPQGGYNSTPIADRFMGGQSSGQTDKLDNALDNYDGTAGSTGQSYGSTTGYSSGTTGYGSGDAVSGAYEGTGAGDALTGQSHAQRTGAGVGPMGENLGGDSGNYESYQGDSYQGDSDITRGPGAHRTVAGGGAVAGQQGEGLGSTYATGVGASGGAGGHYSSGTGAGAGYDSYDSGNNTSGNTYDSGNNASGNTGDYSGDDSGSGATGGGGGRQGHYGAVTDDADRGKPLSNPKDLDTGGPHSLVFDEKTGGYVHRRDL